MKTFLTTTALVSAFALTGVAHAGSKVGGLDVTLGGQIDFQASFTDQDFDASGSSHGFGRELKFENNTEIHVNVEGKSDNGLVYGATIELEADITDDADQEGTNADKTFIYLESGAGRVELGGTSSIVETLKVDAGSIARATGGIDGDWYHYVDVTFANFLVRPDLPLQYGMSNHSGTYEDASKISYYSPLMNGFQAGVSFTPDSGNSGTAAGFTTDTDAGQFEDVFDLGVSYTGEVEGVSIQAAVTGSFGDSESNTTEDLAAWNAGISLGFEGFSLAGSYGDLDDSGTAIGSNSDTDYWTLGAAYESGPVGVSVTYLDSEAGNNDFSNISVGVDYSLAPGLTPYIEASFFELDQGGSNVDNEGTVLLVGTHLHF